MSRVWKTSQSYSSDRFTKSHRHIIPAGNINFQDGKLFVIEKDINSISFSRKIYNKNKNKKILFFNCLVEFGCESLLPHYVLPDLVSNNKHFHLVFIGWQGREYFYKKFADEYWEVKPEYMYLRDYVKAFTTTSKTILNIEKSLKQYGTVFSSKFFGNFFLQAECVDCKNKFGTTKKYSLCPFCSSKNILNSLFSDLYKSKLNYKSLCDTASNYDLWAEKVIGTEKTIGIFARSRQTYARNLPVDFYAKIIENLQNKGYKVIWLGEKTSTLVCPNQNIFDFTKSEYADNIEACLSLVKKCCCTFQCWTASTRFSQMANTPFFLVESPDQIYGMGQEGKRIVLLTQDLNKKKILLCNYKKVMDNLEKFLDVCRYHFFDFIENKNSNDIVGLVDNQDYVTNIMKEKKLW